MAYRTAVLLGAAAATAFLILCAAPASAEADFGQPTPLGNANDTATTPQVAVHHDGRAVAVWAAWNGSRTDIWFAEYASWSGWTQPALLENSDLGTARDPRVVVDGSGVVTVTWIQWNGSRFIPYADREPLGGPWGGPLPFTAAGGDNATAVDMAAAPDGSVTVVWGQVVGLYLDVYAVRFLPAVGWDIPRFAGTGAPGYDPPRIAADGNLNLTAAWGQQNGTAAPRIVAVRFNSSTGWGPEVRVESSNRSTSGVQVAADAHGNVSVVWGQVTPSFDVQVWANDFTSPGGWGMAHILQNPGTGGGQPPALAVTTNGVFIAAWAQADASGAKLWAAMRNASAPWDSPTLMEAMAGYAEVPVISVGGDGNATLAWNQKGSASPGVRARFFVAGRGWGAAGLVDHYGSTYRGGPSIGEDDGGNVTALWIPTGLSDLRTWTNRFALRQVDFGFSSSPAGGHINASGIDIAAPFSFNCLETFAYSVNVSSPQVANGSRLTFANWTGLSVDNGTFECAFNGSAVAVFLQEFLVSFETVPTGLTVGAAGQNFSTPASLWILALNITPVKAAVSQDLGLVRYRLLTWSDGGAPAHGVAVIGPMALVASYNISEYGIDLSADLRGFSALLDGAAVATPQVVWAPLGSLHNLSVLSPQYLTADHRLVFVGWADGSPQNHSFALNGPVPKQAATREQFLVRLLTSPEPLGLLWDVAPVMAPGSVWADNRSIHSLDVPSVDQLDPAGDATYAFVGWEGGSGRAVGVFVTGPLNFTGDFRAQEFRIIISTDPPGLNVLINGTALPSPTSYFWPAHTSAPIAFDAFQGIDRLRYSFSHWREGGSAPLNLSIDAPVDRLAYFSYEVGVWINASSPLAVIALDGADVHTPYSAWWAPGSRHIVGAPALQDTGPGTRIAWSSWSDDGARAHQVMTSVPWSIEAAFAVQFHVLIASAYGSVDCDSPDCWYNQGVLANLTAQSPVPVSQGTRAVFDLWSGAMSGNATPAVVPIEGPVNATAHWRLQYLLTLDSAYGTMDGGGWYPAGADATPSVRPAELDERGVHYVFAGWSATGVAPGAMGAVKMDAPTHLVAVWSGRPSEVAQPVQAWALLVVFFVMAAAASAVAYRRRRAR